MYTRNDNYLSCGNPLSEQEELIAGKNIGHMFEVLLRNDLENALVSMEKLTIRLPLSPL